MARSRIKAFLKDTSGAVATTYALALVGIVAAGGLAFDYSRLVTMDSELQSAADEAAIAAATQLDGTATSITRAQGAVNNYFANSTSAVVNRTLLANDGSGTALSSVSFKFYESYNSSTDAFGTETTDGTKANVVQVTINGRTAKYALTPVVGLLNSGSIAANAVAGLQAAVCKVPPLMICNPNEATGGTFPTAADRGKGIKLEAGGGGTWTSGNYGYLDFGAGAKDLANALGSNSSIDDCIAQSALATKPGNTASVTSALNTRFDIYENGLTNYCKDGIACSPALNVRKDLVHLEWGNGNDKSTNAALNGAGPWVVPSVEYLGVTSPVPTNMGLPRDICHATSKNGSCTNGRFGDGNWDRNLYFQVNHPGTAASVAQTWAGRTTLSELSRYDVYLWEIATSGMLADRYAGDQQSYNDKDKPTGKSAPHYSFSTPKSATGLGPSATQKDRRVLPVAVVNCTAQGISGSTPIKSVNNWVDIFLVEPSVNRSYTSADQIYGEIIGTATRPGGGNAFQYYGRQKAVLLR